MSIDEWALKYFHSDWVELCMGQTLSMPEASTLFGRQIMRAESFEQLIAVALAQSRCISSVLRSSLQSQMVRVICFIVNWVRWLRWPAGEIQELK